MVQNTVMALPHHPVMPTRAFIVMPTQVGIHAFLADSDQGVDADLRRHDGITLRRHDGITLRRHDGITLRRHDGVRAMAMLNLPTAQAAGS